MLNPFHGLIALYPPTIPSERIGRMMIALIDLLRMNHDQPGQEEPTKESDPPNMLPAFNVD